MTMEEVFAKQIDTINSDRLQIIMFMEGVVKKIAIDKRVKDVELWNTLNQNFYFDGYAGDNIPVLKLKSPMLLTILSGIIQK